MHEIKIIYFPKERVFGGMLRPGEFVALAHEDRNLLSKFGFQPVVDATVKRWNELFPGRAMLIVPRPELLKPFEDEEV